MPLWTYIYWLNRQCERKYKWIFGYVWINYFDIHKNTWNNYFISSNYFLCSNSFVIYDFNLDINTVKNIFNNIILHDITPLNTLLIIPLITPLITSTLPAHHQLITTLITPLYQLILLECGVCFVARFIASNKRGANGDSTGHLRHLSKIFEPSVRRRKAKTILPESSNLWRYFDIFQRLTMFWNVNY